VNLSPQTELTNQSYVQIASTHLIFNYSQYPHYYNSYEWAPFTICPGEVVVLDSCQYFAPSKYFDLYNSYQYYLLDWLISLKAPSNEYYYDELYPVTNKLRHCGPFRHFAHGFNLEVVNTFDVCGDLYIPFNIYQGSVRYSLHAPFQIKL
jgi:hypothetical protein